MTAHARGRAGASPGFRRVPSRTEPEPAPHTAPGSAGHAVLTMPWRAASTVLGGAAHAGAAAAATGIGLARTVVRPAGAVGVAVEAAWVAAHFALYPMGALSNRAAPSHGYRLEHLPPAERGLMVRDVEAASTPILLVHGLADNRSVFTVLRRGLRRRGFGNVTTLNYSPLTRDVRTAAVRLAEEVERIVAETGHDRIHIVGHSLGGLVARYYVTRLGGDERVQTVVTLGTPHAGTRVAHLWPSSLCRQLTPGSSLMRELAQPAPDCRTRFIAYWSDLDYAIVPSRSAQVHHPDLESSNVGLTGVGHMSLPILPSVLRGIVSAFTDPVEGDTAAAAT